MVRELDDCDQRRARALAEDASIVWHQRMELAKGVVSPGAHDALDLLGRFDLPARLDGVRAIDIGTTNGSVAFELERRGADVVAVDISDEDHYGFAALVDHFESSVTFVRSSVYDLPRSFGADFDLVVFFGVLYHLRHPLLAVDAVRAIARDRVLVESAVCDSMFPGLANEAIVAYFAENELGGDWSNWFAPTRRALGEWFGGSGFHLLAEAGWPEPLPSRALLDCRVTAGKPDYITRSYEQVVRVIAQVR